MISQPDSHRRNTSIIERNWNARKEGEVSYTPQDALSTAWQR